MKLKAGDTVLVKSFDQLAKEFGVSKNGYIQTKPCRVNKEMMAWCGKFVTIANGQGDTYHIKEDGEKWNWIDDMFDFSKECIILYRNGDKVIGAHKIDGKIITRAEAKCHPIDKFDFSIGATIAFNRLFEIEGQNHEDDNQIKIGDQVKIIKQGKSYTTYTAWLENYEPSLSAYYVYGVIPPNGTCGTVRAIHMHDNEKDVVYAIQTNRKEIFLVNQTGIEKIN